MAAARPSGIQPPSRRIPPPSTYSTAQPSVPAAANRSAAPSAKYSEPAYEYASPSTAQVPASANQRRRKSGPLVMKAPWDAGADNKKPMNSSRPTSSSNKIPPSAQLAREPTAAQSYSVTSSGSSGGTSGEHPQLTLLKSKQAQRRLASQQTERVAIPTEATASEPSHAPLRQQQPPRSTLRQEQRPAQRTVPRQPQPQEEQQLAEPSTVHSYGNDDMPVGGGAPLQTAVIPRSEEPTNLVECSICGRRFAEDRLAKHEAVCGKANKKRKVFNVAAQRVAGTGAEKFVKPTANGVKPVSEVTAGTSAGRGAGRGEIKVAKKSKWRQQREQFMAALRAAKGNGNVEVPPVIDTSLVECPNCGRRFNEEAAKRHIPICKNVFKTPGRGKAAPAAGAKSGPPRAGSAGRAGSAQRVPAATTTKRAR